MALPFPSEDWVQALHERLNESSSYQEAAKQWEGDICFVVNKGDGVPEDTYLYLDLWHGKSRGAAMLDSPGEKSPAFTISGPLQVWKKVVQGKQDPIRALVSRQLKLKGNLMQIMKTPRAATELVNCATQVPTTWPDE